MKSILLVIVCISIITTSNAQEIDSTYDNEKFGYVGASANLPGLLSVIAGLNYDRYRVHFETGIFIDYSISLGYNLYLSEETTITAGGTFQRTDIQFFNVEDPDDSIGIILMLKSHWFYMDLGAQYLLNDENRIIPKFTLLGAVITFN